jgi:hypothetical protein
MRINLEPGTSVDSPFERAGPCADSLEDEEALDLGIDAA